VRLFTKSIALECAAAQDGVRVNSVHPGIIDTPIWDGIIPHHRPARRATTPPPGRPRSTTSPLLTVPLGFKGLPADIAAGVLYLASEESRYVTGASSWSSTAASITR
jgi:NAD(P)-dependent dehydrogenase (short-subunit alcohol dehydrogenase family)